MDFVHENFYMIEEVFIPEVGLCVNPKASFLYDEPPEELPYDESTGTGVKPEARNSRIPLEFEEIELDAALDDAATVLAKALGMKQDAENVLRHRLSLEKR